MTPTYEPNKEIDAGYATDSTVLSWIYSQSQRARLIAGIARLRASFRKKRTKNREDRRTTKILLKYHHKNNTK